MRENTPPPQLSVKQTSIYFSFIHIYECQFLESFVADIEMKVKKCVDVSTALSYLYCEDSVVPVLLHTFVQDVYGLFILMYVCNMPCKKKRI